MKNEKQIKIDGYKCIKLDEWKTEWKAEKVKYVIGKAEDEEFPSFYAKVQRVNDNDDLIDDDYIFEYDHKPERSAVEDDFIDENTGKIIHCALKDNDPINKCLTMNCGMKASIIKYRSHNDIDIQFEDGTIIKHRDFRDFCKGKIANPNLSKRKSWEDVRITNIQWDASDDVMAGLPDKVNALDLNINLSQYDTNEDLDYNEDFLYGVSEALSEKYGFCHDGFELEISMGKMESKIVGIINQFGENDFSYWTGFCLNDEEQKQIEEILHRHDTEGCSIRGTRSDISNEIKE